MSRRRTPATRKASGRKTKKTAWWQRLRDWRPGWRLRGDLGLGPVQQEIAGLLLLILAALTILGLSDISSGAILDWWARALSRLLGWGAYGLALSLGVYGLWLLWRDLHEHLDIGPKRIIGFELFFLALLATSHAPLVQRNGADAAFLAAEQGHSGGYVGWALAVLLMERLGVVLGSLLLLAATVAGLYLLLSVPWEEGWAWGQHQGRRGVAALSRWWTARQGRPVAPEPAETPWWEQEPDPAEVQARKKTTPKPTARTRSPRRTSNGDLPSLGLLEPSAPHTYGDADVRYKTRIIEETLASFGVPVQVVEVNQGPTVTQFGLDPGYVERRVGGEVQQQRVRVGKIASLQKDLALALAASPIRIEAPVPGKSVVGLEVPNETISLVSLRGVMESEAFKRIGSRLAIALGENVSGRPVAVDLALMPHLLIAGATGSGKSVCINAVVCCLLFNNTPEDLRMLMIDPKRVELIGYNDVPHLLAPVVVDVEQVVGALAWITRQMDQRYKLFHQAGARNLEEYNRQVGRRKDEEPLPTLVIFIDELADLMMVAPDEVERHICRVAQMGRATGIHLVIATQRPSVDVVTGLIKANFPARISFAVTSQVDSRVILDQGGAENLLGRGDMLFVAPQQSAPIRLQGCFVSDQEINRLTSFWRDRADADRQLGLFPSWTQFGLEEEADDLLEQAIQLARGRETVSTSFIQRRLNIGFPRAARLVEQLEEQGVVGPDQGGGRGRQVLLGRAMDFDEIEERLPGEAPD